MTTHRMHKLALPILVSLTAGIALAQQDGRISPDGINDPPTLEERIVEERIVAEQAAKELLAEEEAARKKEELAAGRGAEPLEPDTHASREAPAELIALAAREPERFIGKTLVLDDGVNAVEVGPVLDLRRRIKDGVLHVVVDATAYFNSPTHYAVAVRDLDRIDGDLLVTPEAAGMHLRGLDYYPEDYTDVMDTSPADVLADNVDESDLEDGIREEPGEIEIRRF